MGWSSLLPSIAVLGTAALAAAFVSLKRPLAANPAAIGEASRTLALATGVQAVHFLEEAFTGLHAGLPALIGAPPIPLPLFVGFNVAWLVAWTASVPGLRARRAAALFAAWFLAIAGVVNGIAHPLLAVASGGYFSGLISAPVVGAICVWLGIRLRRATVRR